jgi:hypothetical protein
LSLPSKAPRRPIHSNVDFFGASEGQQAHEQAVLPKASKLMGLEETYSPMVNLAIESGAVVTVVRPADDSNETKGWCH